MIQAVSGVLGIAVLVVLAMRKQWVVILGLCAYAAAYAWYFPPIPAYHFGAYLLLVLGLIMAVCPRPGGQPTTPSASRTAPAS